MLLDNVTHTLIGITLGRTAAGKNTDPKWAQALVWTGVIGNNLPDIDFLTQYFFPGAEVSRLAYLLHHRGFTHTLLAALPLGALAAWLGGRFARTRFSVRLFAFGVFSVLVHLFADFWNEYGVHPFSPFWDGWIYGDSIFILEPALWLVMAPLALRGKFYAGLRTLWWVPIAGILFLLWRGDYSPLPVATAMTLLFAASFALFRRTQAPKCILGLACAVVFCFALAGRHAKSEVRRALLLESPEWANPSDVLAIPAPGNPFCWRIIVAAPLAGDRVTAVGVWSGWPRVFPPASCHLRGITEWRPDLPFAPSLLASKEHLKWLMEFRGSLEELRALRRENSAFERFLGFARFPFWKANPQEDRLQFGDIRFARGSGRGFAEFSFPSRTTEGAGLPRWKGALDEIR